MRSIRVPPGLEGEELVGYRKGFQRGIAQGFAQGMMEGVEIGFEKGSRDAVLNLVRMLVAEDESEETVN